MSTQPNLIVMQPQPAKKPRQRDKAPASLTPDELIALLRAAREHSARAWCGILLGYKHGLRVSEICDLRLSDITLDIRGKADSIRVRRLKGSLETIQPLTKQVGQPLLDEPRAIREWLAERSDATDYVFTSQKGGKLDRSSFFRLFQQIAEAAGLPPEKRHCHILKHALACHLVAKATNIAFVKTALGHKSIASTMVYASISDEQAAVETARIFAETF